MYKMDGKVALVTGATGGIGDAIAKKIHASGATVVLTGRNTEKLNALRSELKDRVIVIAADLSKTEDCERLVRETIESAGRLDILVNNAGMTKDGLMMRMSDQDFEEVIRVNLTAVFKLCRASIMPMIKNRYGRIINITSIVGHLGNAGQANYTASKGALTSMTKTLSAEVAKRGITANCVAPGFIQTPMTDVLPEEIKTMMLNQIPMDRFGNPDDIANAVLFLASDDASYITGQTIHVNGGMARF